MYKMCVNGMLEVNVKAGDKPSDIIRKCIAADSGKIFFHMSDGLRNVIMFRGCDNCASIGDKCNDCPFADKYKVDRRVATKQHSKPRLWTSEYKERYE